MKLYNWIDSLFDSREKRRTIFLIVILVYWLWQNVWQSIFYYQLSRLTDYNSLFTFYESMDQYNQSLLINVIFEIIMRSTMPLLKLMGYICEEIHFVDVFMIGSSLLLFASSQNKKKWFFVMMALFALIIFDLVLILMGFHQGSLSEVMHLLIVLAYGSIGIEFWILAHLLMQMYECIKNLIKYTYVHDL